MSAQPSDNIKSTHNNKETMGNKKLKSLLTVIKYYVVIQGMALAGFGLFYVLCMLCAYYG